MIALILNSGMGSRMGDVSKLQPKCMTSLNNNETILGRQLRLIQRATIFNVVVTTGKFDVMIQEHCHTYAPELEYVFVKNPIYDKTNYIYSIYLAQKYLHDDVLLMHGDMVFEDGIIQDMIQSNKSCMAVCKSQSLPQKDFKAVMHYSIDGQRTDNFIEQIGIDCFENAYAAQPLYYLKKKDWELWLNEIISFCERKQVNCYAENAFNRISDKCLIYPYEIGRRVCGEIDTCEDLYVMRERI